MKRQAVVPAPFDALADAGGQLPGILELKQARLLSQRLVVAARARVVDRFWTEKLLVAVDALQLFALLWQLSQPWPWPARWLRWTRWTNAFNADVFSFGATGAAMGATAQPFSLWGERRQYWAYALAFGFAPYALCGLLWLAATRWRRQGRADALQRRIAWENALLVVLYVAYAPVGLAVVRLLNCDTDGRVAVDPIAFPTCWSATHLLAMASITGCLGGGFLVAFPLWLRRRVDLVVFTADAVQHETFLQSKELAFIVGASDAYAELYMPLYASFRCHAVHVAVAMCGAKLTLLAAFSSLRSLQGLQGGVFFAVFLLLAWRQTWRPAFRVDSTNRVASALAWLLVANGVIALLCANHVRSALTVATSVTASLSFINLCGFAAAALPTALSVRQWRRRRELEPARGHRLLTPHATWPTHSLMEPIVNSGSPLEDWVALLRRVRALSVATLTAGDALQPFHELGAALQQLDEAWRAASASGHLLSDLLYQELLMLSDLFVDALAASPFREIAARDGHNALFRSLAETLRRREDQQRTLSAAQRRVLRKLRAARTWAMDGDANTIETKSGV